MKRKKVKPNHHVPEWTFIGAAIVLGTMACSFSLPDISNLPRLVALAISLGVFFLCSRQVRAPRSLGAAAYALFAVLTLASTAWAVNKGEALYDAARWVTACCLFLTLYTLHRRHPVRTIVMLSRVAAVVVVVSVGVALWQLDALGGDFSWDNRYSIVSLHTHKGAFSLLLLLCTLPVVLRLRLRGKRRAVSLLYWGVLALALVTLFFLSARTTLLSLVALGVVLALTFIPLKPVGGRWRWLATLAAAMLMGGIFLGGTRLFCRLPLGETPGEAGGALSSTTVHERYALWNTTLRLVDRHPLLGVGAGNWKVCYPEVSTKDIFSADVLDFNFVRPHNDYLRVLSETGYIGLALLLLALAAPIVRAIGHCSRHRRTGRMTATTLAYVAAVLTAALVDFPFDRTELMLWCVVAVALLAASTPGRVCPLGAVRFAFAALLAAVVLLAVVRIQSEKQYPVITAANHGRRWYNMEQAARKARSPWCSLTPVGTPIAYYEALAQEQQHKPAMQTYAEALHDSPWHKQSLNDMGRLVYTTLHDADSAEALFRKAIMVSPSFSYAWFNLAQLYLQEGRPDESRKLLEQYDIDAKEARIWQLVWKYLSGDQALYYQHSLPQAERRMKDALLANSTPPLN